MSALFGYYHTSGQNILDSDNNSVLLKGVGLGGWLVPEGYMLKFPGFGSPTSIHNQILNVLGEENTEEFYRRYRANYVTKEDILTLKDWGYNHIRLPFHYEIFESKETPYQFTSEGFAVIDTFMNWCRDADMPVILDLHCAPGGQNSGNISDSDGTARLWLDTQNKQFTIDIWQAIAAHYANDELIIGYDLLNETVLPDGHSTIELRGLMMDIRNAIRQVDKHHILFIEGNIYATDFSDLTPPFDANMVYAFHKYWSETTQASYGAYTAIRSQWSVPLWLGETGENSNDWHFEALRSAEALNIGWCTWTHKKFETLTAPYSANLPVGFSELTEYWNGNSGKPSETVATALLYRFAENLKSENCIFHPDILYAQLHPDYGAKAIPYKELTIPGIIDAVDFDMGIYGQTYTDTDYRKTRWDLDMPWNKGYAYRNDGVDIEPCYDTNGTVYNIGWTEDSEWFSYTVNVEVDGIYRADLRIAANSSGGQFLMALDDQTFIPVTNVPHTGGYQNWDTVTISDLTLSKGSHILKFLILNGGFNLNRLTFTLTGNDIMTPLLPTAFIGDAYPNPFNTTVTIPLLLQGDHSVKVVIYNLQGQQVRTVVNGTLGTNLHHIHWNGIDDQGQRSPSGIYFATVTVNHKQHKQKLVLVY